MTERIKPAPGFYIAREWRREAKIGGRFSIAGVEASTYARIIAAGPPDGCVGNEEMKISQLAKPGDVVVLGPAPRGQTVGIPIIDEGQMRMILKNHQILGILENPDPEAEQESALQPKENKKTEGIVS